MTNHTRENPYAKIFYPSPFIARRTVPRNNIRKTKPFHVASPRSRVPPIRNDHNQSQYANNQSPMPNPPIPPNNIEKTPSSRGFIEQAAHAMLSQTSSDWSRGSNARRGQVFKRPTAPYESVSTASNSRRHLGISGNNAAPLSTSSKVNKCNMSTPSNKEYHSRPSSNVRNEYKSTRPSINTGDVNSVYKAIESRNVPSSVPSTKIYSTKHVANARESGPSTHPKSKPPLHPKKRKRSRQKRNWTKSSPSSPKGKRSPPTARRATPEPPPPFRLEPPQSPLQPTLNRNIPKPQICRSTKQPVVPEHASRPAEPVFPLVDQSLRQSLSAHLRIANDQSSQPKETKQRRVQFGENSILEIPRIGTKKVNAKNLAVRPLQEQQTKTSLEKSKLDLSSEDDMPISRVFGPRARNRVEQDKIKSNPERAVEDKRHLVMRTLTSKPIPLSKSQLPMKETNKSETLQRSTSAKAPNPSPVTERREFANLQTRDEERPRNSMPRDQFTRKIVPPIKKRRVAEKRSDPVLKQSSTVSRYMNKARQEAVVLDLKSIEKSHNSKTAVNAGVSPISVLEVPFDLSFENPAISELRNLNRADNQDCLLGRSVKTASRTRPPVRSGHSLSFERRRQKLFRPVYIADPRHQRMMEEALAAVNSNVRLEKNE